MSDLKISDIIKFEQDTEKNNPYLYIDLSKINNLDNIKSVQYWYWDTNTSSYHFVFGVNITDEDKVKKLSIGDNVTVKGKITSVGEVIGYHLDIDSIE